MKRILAVLLLWVVVFGGLHLYLKRFESVRTAAPPPPSREAEASAAYALEITTTFTVESDPFALQTDNSGKPAALLVRLGQQILKEVPEVEAGIPVRVTPVQGIVSGMNEFFVEAAMPLDMSGKSLALRLRLLRDELTVAEKTFWSEGENRVAGTFRVELKEQKNKESHHE